MTFPLTHREIREMVGEEVLKTEIARGIARKAGLQTIGGTALALADLGGSFSFLPDENADSYVGAYFSQAEFYFPDDTAHMDTYLDLQGATQARLLVTVADEGIEGTSLLVEVMDGSGIRGFQEAPPSCPLDSVGLHISAWQTFNSSSLEQYPQVLRWIVSNPDSAAGEFSVGLCQLQVR